MEKYVKVTFSYNSNYTTEVFKITTDFNSIAELVDKIELTIRKLYKDDTIEVYTKGIRFINIVEI